MDYQRLKEIASQPAKDSAELLGALAMLAALRRELDEIERDLIQDARDSGVSWARVATALGLASRQAAEQRLLRLQGESRRDPGWARSSRARRSEQDRPAVVDDLAKAADAAHRELRARTDSGARVSLAAATLRQARSAPPGSLFDLVGRALADLGEDTGPAVVALRYAFESARPEPSASPSAPVDPPTGNEGERRENAGERRGRVDTI
jgi:hypothetical protein